MLRRALILELAFIAFVCNVACLAPESNQQSTPPTDLITSHFGVPIVANAVHQDVSPPVRELQDAPNRSISVNPAQSSLLLASMFQSTQDSRALQFLLSFDGVGNAFTGPQGTFSVAAIPPNPTGAAGINRYAHLVNSSFAFFDKSANVIYGPAKINSLWAGFGGGCETTNDGNGVVKYDWLADRWVMTQWSIFSSTPELLCIAVSTSNDPTGSYYRYSFAYPNTPIGNSLGIWPDAYYVTSEIVTTDFSTLLGGMVCAYDRTSMLSGLAAMQQCVSTGASYHVPVASDLDGWTPPPSASPNFVINLGINSVNLWKFHVDWGTPANSTFLGPTNIPVASFIPACQTDPAVLVFQPTPCIPQAFTTQRLAASDNFPVSRLPYRNFGDHESLLASHSITTGSTVGLRWYELRNPSGTPVVYQQGTYAPSDSNYRWTGATAMDHAGNIALGFSLSSEALYPSIRYTGRLASDPLGVMTQVETEFFSGRGSQFSSMPGAFNAKWGYSGMSVDPGDDCTFWYTNTYRLDSGLFNWRTRVGKFKQESCAACPAGLSLCRGLCTQTATDPNNCSSCGVICPGTTNGQATCVNSQCGLTCNAGYTACGNQCVNTSSDVANCGTCQHSCGANATCGSGVCSCSSGFTNCGGNCLALLSDVNNCGSCGNVCPFVGGATRTCVSGQCGYACNAGYHDCGGSCVLRGTLCP